jgi:hypothetical protein
LVRILEELGGFDGLNFAYSQNAKKTDAPPNSGSICLDFQLVAADRCDETVS